MQVRYLSRWRYSWLSNRFCLLGCCDRAGCPAASYPGCGSIARGRITGCGSIVRDRRIDVADNGVGANAYSRIERAFTLQITSKQQLTRHEPGIVSVVCLFVNLLKKTIFAIIPRVDPRLYLGKSSPRFFSAANLPATAGIEPFYLVAYPR